MISGGCEIRVATKVRISRTAVYDFAKLPAPVINAHLTNSNVAGEMAARIFKKPGPEKVFNEEGFRLDGLVVIVDPRTDDDYRFDFEE